MSYVHTRKLHTGEINPKHCLNEERFRITEIRPRFVSFRLNPNPKENIKLTMLNQLVFMRRGASGWAWSTQVNGKE